MNTLEPGAAGLPSPSPADEKANPLGPGQSPNGATVAPRSEMLRQFDSVEDRAAEQFKKLKALEPRMKVLLDGLTRLAKLGDTVKPDDVVSAAGDYVAAGAPAVEVAGVLAEMPQNSEALQAWVQSKALEAAQQNQMLQQALGQAAWQLGLASFQSILADSAEAFHAKRRRSLN